MLIDWICNSPRNVQPEHEFTTLGVIHDATNIAHSTCHALENDIKAVVTRAASQTCVRAQPRYASFGIICERL